MKQIIILLALALPFTLASNKAVFSRPKPLQVSAVDVAAAARVCQCEAENQSIKGQIFVIDVLRNRAAKKGISIIKASYQGICRGSLRPEFVRLAANVLKQPPCHPYTYFFNPQKSTDKKWVRFGLSQQGEMIGAHWFFSLNKTS